MPALPPVPGVVKIVASGDTPVNNWANVFHATFTGASPSFATLSTIATDLSNEWSAPNSIQTLQTADTFLTKITVTDLTTDMGAEGVWEGSIQGTNGEDPLPGNVCTLVSYQISRRYRGGHPRTYLNAGGDGNLQDMSHWNTGYVGDVVNAMNIWCNALYTVTSGGTSLTAQCCVSYVDRASNPIPPYRRAVPLVEVIGNGVFKAEAQLASQRRRIGRK